MKKLFFSLLAAACSLTASAQVEPVSGTAYYLYNTESGQFLTRGKSWGTQAIVESVGLPWQVTVADGKYKLHMLDIAKADGNTNRGLGSNGFTDNGSPAALEVSGTADAYTLSFSVAGDNTISMSGTSTWQFLTTEQYRALQASKTAAQNAAIATAAGLSGDISTIVTNPSEWASKDVSSKVPAVNNTNWAPTKNGDRKGNQNQGTYGVESYTTGDATYSCTISGLQPGVYKVGVKALHRTTTNAADLAVGNAGYDCSSAYLDANGYRVAVKDWYSSRTGDATPNSTGQFVDIANAGGYYSEVFTYVGEDGVLNLKAAATSYWGSCWFLFNSCTLTYYTNAVSEEDATAILAAVPTDAMDANAKSNLDNAKANFEGAQTMANYNALLAAIESANASVATYAAAKKVADGAKAKATAANVELDATAFDAAYEAGNLNGNTEAEALATAVNTAINDKIAGCTDKTAKITNPSFEDGKLTGWTNSGFNNPATNKNFGALTGNLFVEKWTPGGGKLADGSLKQTIANLPVGEYILTVDAKNEQQSGNTAETGAFVIIGTNRYEINSTSVDHCAIALNVTEKSDVEIGIVLDGCTGNWVCFDNFKLYFNGIDPEGLAEEIANATTLYNSYDATKQYAVDLKTAIDAAQASYDGGFTSVETLNAAVNALLAAVDVAKHAARVESYAQLENGKYVLSLGGKFLGAGNSWGTQASLLAHPEYVELAKLEDGKYTIKSQVSNGGQNNYFTGSYMDGAATGVEIIIADGGLYLSDGTKYYFNNNGVVGLQDEPVSWTVTSLAEMDAKIEDATDENPYDITYKLGDPNFGRNNVKHSAWVENNVTRGGANENNLYEAFQKTFSIKQTITDLPVGYYVVKATAMYRQDGEDVVPYIFANDVKVNFAERTGTENDMAAAAASMASGMYEVSARVLVTNGTLVLGAATEGTSCWAIFDNFQLYAAKRGLPAVEADYAALNTAIEAAEANVIGFQEGQYSPYANADAIKALADAKALDQNSENLQDVVLALAENLSNATWTVNTEEVNAINNGDFEGDYAAVSGAGVSSDREIYLPSGWSFRKNGINTNDIVVLNSTDRAANNVTAITALENGGNNTVMYRGKWGNNTNLDFYQKITLPAGTYTLSCDAWKSGLGGDGKIYVGVDNEATLSGNETSWRKLSLTFTLSEEKTVEVGFNIKHNSDGSEKFIAFDNFDLKLAEAEATIAVSDAKWATFIAPFDVTIPAGIEAYSCEAQDENNVLTLVQVETTIPANTPVILNAAEPVSETQYGKNMAGKDEYTAGWLTGTYVDKAVGEGCLMLAKKDGVVAFYNAPAGRTNKAGKAYLTLPAEAKATALYFPGDADAIQAIEALANGNAKIYDLNGRQQNKLQKGINIVNGHKVMVK